MWPAVGAQISNIRNLSEELAAALDAPNCPISRRRAAVTVKMSHDDPQPVRLLPLYNQLTNHSSIPPVTTILGLAEDRAPLLIRLPSPDVAPILVAGTTGSGKTMLLQTMILSLAMTNLPVGQTCPAGSLLSANGSRLSMVLIDPKGHAFGLFEGLPHLARQIVQDVEETTEAFQNLAHLMERRGRSRNPL